MRKFFTNVLAGTLLLLSVSGMSFADGDIAEESHVRNLKRDHAISHLTDEYNVLKIGKAADRAEKEVDAMIDSMENMQRDMEVALDELETRVDSLQIRDSRKKRAEELFENAENAVEKFTDLEPDSHLDVQPAGVGVLPRVTADGEFNSREGAAQGAISELRTHLIRPARPGAVPTGDVVSDFIPQLIRQLFRFAWLAIFIALTVAGVMLITAHDNEERVTKAKSIFTITLIGFAFVTLAFALVKAITDIDFFNFI